MEEKKRLELNNKMMNEPDPVISIVFETSWGMSRKFPIFPGHPLWKSLEDVCYKTMGHELERGNYMIEEMRRENREKKEREAKES